MVNGKKSQIGDTSRPLPVDVSEQNTTPDSPFITRHKFQQLLRMRTVAQTSLTEVLWQRF